MSNESENEANKPSEQSVVSLRVSVMNDNQFKDVAIRWCEQQGIDPNDLSNVPRLGACVGYQAFFKPMWEAIVDEMKRLDKEDSMRRFLNDYKNDVLFPPSVLGYKAGNFCFAPNLSGEKKSD